MLFLFWFLVMSLLSSWDDMYVPVKLLAYNVWADEDDKTGFLSVVKLVGYDVWFAEDNITGFLSVGLDIFDRLYLKEWPIYLPMVPMSTIKQKYDKWGQLRKLNKSKYEIFLISDQNINPPIKNSKYWKR